MEPDAVEIRVLGCLIEKQRTTPDAYPLSLNALRLACNQSTNRNPVVDYDEGVIKDALQRTYRRGWTRLASGHGSRAAKYRHLLDEALGLAPGELALLGVLMLRGAQTPGELKQRSERLQRFDDLAAVEATLASLIGSGHVERLPRQPGQKEERFRQLLGGEAAASAEPSAQLRAGQSVPARPDDSAGGAAEIVSPPPPARSAAPVLDPAVDGRIAALEREVAELRAALSALRDELGP
ncbi:MAG TPA: YceH family protein [Conexibacter sp.]